MIMLKTGIHGRHVTTILWIIQSTMCVLEVFKCSQDSEHEEILQLTSLWQISFDEWNETETPKRTLHDFTIRLERLADSIISISKYEH